MLKKKINIINFFYQIKNFFYILRFSSPKIIGDYSKNNINNYKTLIVSWSNEEDFAKNGEYFDRYYIHTYRNIERDIYVVKEVRLQIL